MNQFLTFVYCFGVPRGPDFFLSGSVTVVWYDLSKTVFKA